MQDLVYHSFDELTTDRRVAPQAFLQGNVPVCSSACWHCSNLCCICSSFLIWPAAVRIGFMHVCGSKHGHHDDQNEESCTLGPGYNMPKFTLGLMLGGHTQNMQRVMVPQLQQMAVKLVVKLTFHAENVGVLSLTLFLANPKGWWMTSVGLIHT